MTGSTPKLLNKKDKKTHYAATSAALRLGVNGALEFSIFSFLFS